MTEHSFLLQQKIGDQFSGVYYVSNVSIKKTKSQSEYTEFTLKDRSGTVFAKFWSVDPSITKGSYVSAAINVDDYQGKPSFIIRNIAMNSKEIDESLYVPVAENLEELKSSFESHLKHLSEDGDKNSSPVREILEIVLSPAVKAEFLKVPSSLGVFYGKVGGALENTMNVYQICLTLGKVYGLSEDENLVLRTAALLSLVPSIESYKMNNCAAEITKTGLLLGNRTLGILRTFEAWKTYRDSDSVKKASDKEWFLRILHAMNSAEATDSIPATKEAILLNMAKQLDSRTVEMLDYIGREECFENGFTTYDCLNKRKYYVSSKA